MKVLNYSIIIMLFTFLMQCSNNTSSTSSDTDSLKIGVFLPIYKNNPIDGNSNKAIAEYAINSYNDGLAKKDRIYLEFKDHGNSIDQGISVLDNFRTENIKMVVGANTSASLFILMEYIEDLLLINTTSTLASLNDDDNLFRLVPNDTETAKVLANFYIYSGIKKLIVLNLNDSWASGLSELIEQEFTSLGGEILHIESYEPFYSINEYDTILSGIDSIIAAQDSLSNIDEVGIELVSLEEGVDIIHQAMNYPNLLKVKWFGSDGIGQNSDLLNNELIDISSEISLWSPVLGEPENDEYSSVKSQITEELGYEPKVIDMIIYDGIISAANTVSYLSQDDDISLYKNHYHDLMENYTGLGSVSISLGENGDRQTSIYDFWGITYNGGKLQWTKKYKYNNGIITEVD